MRINIEDVQEHIKFRQMVNHQSLSNIEWYEDGKRIYIDQKVIDDFEYTGLNNIDFIYTEYYLKSLK